MCVPVCAVVEGRRQLIFLESQGKEEIALPQPQSLGQPLPEIIEAKLMHTSVTPEDICFLYNFSFMPSHTRQATADAQIARPFHV